VSNFLTTLITPVSSLYLLNMLGKEFYKNIGTIISQALDLIGKLIGRFLFAMCSPVLGYVACPLPHNIC